MPTDRQRRLRDRYYRTLRGAGEGDPVGRAGQFDFSQAFDESMRGYRRDFMEDFGRAAEGVRSSLAGSGRLLTGFGDEDYRRWEDTQGENFANAAAQQSTQLARSQYGVQSDAARRYLDLLTGGLDREQARANAERQRQSGLFSGIGSLAGGLAGTFLLPGVGSAAGASIGGSLGQGLGAYA